MRSLIAEGDAERSTFTIQLASPPDREKLIAEVFLDNEQIAEINEEGNESTVEIYPIPRVGHGPFRWAIFSLPWKGRHKVFSGPAQSVAKDAESLMTENNFGATYRVRKNAVAKHLAVICLLCASSAHAAGPATQTVAGKSSLCSLLERIENGERISAVVVAAAGRRGVGDREDLRPRVEACRFGIG